MTATRRIPTSRLLVGILLHFCVPAYLLLCLAAAFLKAPVVSGWADVPARMLWAAGWFVPGFLLTTLAAAGAGALLDRQDRTEKGAQAAAAAVHYAPRLVAGINHERMSQALSSLRCIDWDFNDPRHQQIATDFAAAAHRFSVAYASAERNGKAAIGDLAAESFGTLAAAANAVCEERRRLDEGDARTVAGYLAARYGEVNSPPL